MALDMEEQDQEENLKNLWSKYKNIAFIAIGIFLCFYIAATFISNKKNKANELASQLYQEVLMEKMDNLEQIKVKTDLVKKDHSNTPYAGRASLHLGQLYAKTGDYDKSIPELSWAGEKATELSIQSLAHYALAYIYIAKKDATKAKLAAEEIATPGYKGLKSDLLGDIALMDGDHEAARSLFNQALDFYRNKSELAQVIQTKLDAIGQ